MGRDKRNEKRGEHFTKMIRTTMEEPAWRALSPTAQALYPWLRLEWKGPEANNNGKIRMSVRQAADRLGVWPDAASRAFHDLQAKGFIVMTEAARLGVEGAAKSPAYEITEIKLPHGDGNDGRKLYRQWRPGQDYPVHKTTANNPRGSNGKTKPCHENRDGTVTEIVTKFRRPS